MFEKVPNVYKLENLIKPTDTFTTHEGKWVPARPMGWGGGLYGLKLRFKLAWLVFSGKADAVVWPGNQ